MRSKYRAQKTTIKGVTYASKLEADYSQVLALRLKAREFKAVEAQVSIPLRVNGSLICRYIADWKVTLPDGTQQLIDTKGVLTPAFRIKAKLHRVLYPDLPLVIVRRDRAGNWSHETL